MIAAPIYQRPSTLEEALQLLALPGSVPTILAGGTDVMVWMRSGAFDPERIVDVSAFRSSLSHVIEDGEQIAVGALCTHAEMAAHPLVCSRLPLLAAAAGSVGAPPIRNRGTLGGNISGSSPAGDMLPVLLVYDARVVLRSLSGSREVPYSQFCTGYRRTVRRDDEMLTEVRFALPPTSSLQRWYKVGGRRAQACSKVNMAAIGRLDGSGRVDRVEMSMGSCAATAVKLLHVMEAVLGQSLDCQVLERAGEALSSDIRPIDDVRSSAQYRLSVARNLVLRFLDELRSFVCQGDLR